MGTVVSVDAIGGKWIYEFDFTITAAGAVVANSDGSTSTDPEISVVRASAGTYTATIRGNFNKVIRKASVYNPTAASSIQSQITGVSLGGGALTASGESTTTVTIITGNSNAVPAAADQTSGSVSVYIAFQKNKI